MMKCVSIFISNLKINSAVYVKLVDNNWYNNLLLLFPNCYEVVVRCGCNNWPLWFMLGPQKLSLQATINYHGTIETVSPEGTFCDTVQIPSSVGDMELI